MLIFDKYIYADVFAKYDNCTPGEVLKNFAPWVHELHGMEMDKIHAETNCIILKDWCRHV